MVTETGERHSSLAILLRWITPPTITLALYWPALRLPFFWDDVAVFRFMEGLSLLEIWTSAESYPYYRPLGFAILQAWGWLFGQTNTVAFHALNLLVLTANGWLVGIVATRVSKVSEHDRIRGLPTDWYGWMSGALLTAFPFAVQAVLWVAALFHLLVTFVVLLAAVALFKYQSSKHWGWGILFVTCTSMAPFIHESGVATAVLMTTIWLSTRSPTLRPDQDQPYLTQWRHKWRKCKYETGSMLIALGLLLNMLFPALWATIPRSHGVSGLPLLRPPSEIWHNAVFFLEALTFPVQPLARHLGWNGMESVLAVGALSLVATASIIMRFGHGRWLLLGLGYSLAASLPSILTLQKLYVVVSPRLMFFPAPGAVLLWCGVIAALAHRVQQSIHRDGIAPAVSAGMLMMMLAVPAHYIKAKVQLHVRALAPVWGMINAVQAYPNEHHLVVNPTTWLASADITYPIVHDGVVVIPEYHNPEQLAAIHTGQQHLIDGINFPLIATEPEYHYYDVWGEVLHWEAMAEKLRIYDRVWLVTYGDGPLGFSEVGQVKTGESQALTDAPIASFGFGRVVLEKARARVTDLGIQVELDWTMAQPSTEDVFAHALDCTYNVLGMADGPPLGRMFPLWLWKPGEIVRDVRTIPISAETLNGCYIVEVGLFDPKSLTRTDARGWNGKPLPNNVLYLRVTSNEVGHSETVDPQD